MNIRSTDSLCRLLDHAKHRDPLGDRAHFILACLYLLTVPLGPAPEAIALGILGGYSILRVWVIYRTWGRLFLRSPLIWLLALSALWLCTSILWSRDYKQALDEISDLRTQIPFILCIWPILSLTRFRALITALTLGVVMMTAVQLGQQFDVNWCIAIGFHGLVPGRPPGLLHPSLTALLAMTTGAFAITDILFATTPWRRSAAVLILIISIISILLTGSRGPMFATLITWLVVTIMSWRNATRNIPDQSAPEIKIIKTRQFKLTRKLIPIAALIIIIITLAGAWWLINPTLQNRTTRFIEESKQALFEHEYHTDVGIRIKQAQIALHAFAQHPILGIGAGSYLSYANATYNPTKNSSTNQSPTDRVPVRDHPHSALLYTLAMTGLPGIILYLAFWILLFTQSLSTARHTVSRNPLLLALPGLTIGLFLAFAVDSQNLSAPGMVILSLITAIVAYQQMILNDSSPSTPPSPPQKDPPTKPLPKYPIPTQHKQQSLPILPPIYEPPANHRRTWLCAFIMITLLTLLFFADAPILRWYFSFDLPAWLWTQETFWSKYGHLIIIIAGLIFLFIKDKFRFFDGLIALAFTLVAVSILKHTIGRARPSNAADPFLFFGLNAAHDSYPSGHTAAVWVIAFAMLRAYGRLGWLWVLLGFIIIWARMHTLAHFFTDSLAAIVIAYYCETAARALLQTIQNHQSQPDQPLKITAITRSLMTGSIIVVLPVLITIPFHTKIPPRRSTADYDRTIATMYLRIMNRPVDDGAHDLWMNKLPRVRLISDPIFQFALSSEFFRSIRNTNSETQARVNDLYHRLLDRLPTTEEFQLATTLLNKARNHQDKHALQYAIRLLAVRIILSKEYQQNFGPFSMPGDPVINPKTSP